MVEMNERVAVEWLRGEVMGSDFPYMFVGDLTLVVTLPVANSGPSPEQDRKTYLSYYVHNHSTGCNKATSKKGGNEMESTT